jgi:RNA polymerase sigma-70 factor (ECF subfamily)
LTGWASASLDLALPLPGATGGSRRARSASVDQAQALDRFLSGVERRAFRIARMAVRNDDDALDIVQEAMIKLARHYAGRPSDEWRPLFYRILNNGIRDFMRRRRVRSRVMAWWPGRAGDEEDEGRDPIQAAPDPSGGPLQLLEGAEALEALEAGLAALPDRQREAFVLRALEGLDVAGTAVAMGCSEGSVKTHYFRAVQALKARLGE